MSPDIIPGREGWAQKFLLVATRETTKLNPNPHPTLKHLNQVEHISSESGYVFVKTQHEVSTVKHEKKVSGRLQRDPLVS